MSPGDVGEAFVCAVAAALAIWVLVPPVATSLRGLRIRTYAVRDPGAARPAGDDRQYQDLFDQLVALGFEPAGIELEVGWFLSVWDWRKRFEQRWLTLPGGRALASVTRLIPDEPCRLNVTTMLSDGHLVRTSCPGADGLADADPKYLYGRLPGADARELLAFHEERVRKACDERGLSIVADTFAEVAAVDAAYGERLLNARADAHWPVFRTYCFFPAAFVLSILGLAHHQIRLFDVACAVGIGSILTRLVRDFIVMPNLRARILASHRERRG